MPDRERYLFPGVLIDQRRDGWLPSPAGVQDSRRAEERDGEPDGIDPPVVVSSPSLILPLTPSFGPAGDGLTANRWTRESRDRTGITGRAEEERIEGKGKERRRRVSGAGVWSQSCNKMGSFIG